MQLLSKSLGFWARKLLHLSMNGSIAVLALVVPPLAIRPLTVVGFILVLVFESLRLKTRAKQYVNDAVGPLFKAEEALDYSGLFWAAIGALVIAQFAGPLAYSYGFAALALCDASAASIGKLLRRRPFYREKTVPGSMMFFFMAFLVSAVYASFSGLTVPWYGFAAVMATILCVLEMFSYPFDDNFLILVTAAYGFHIAATWV